MHSRSAPGKWRDRFVYLGKTKQRIKKKKVNQKTEPRKYAIEIASLIGLKDSDEEAALPKIFAMHFNNNLLSHNQII